MLRVTELRLPLDHDDDALRAAVAARLGVGADALLDHAVARRGFDARSRGRISLVYSVDARVADEAAVLRRCADDPHVGPMPDLAYRPPAPAPPALTTHLPAPRPVVIGAGPCGLLAALTLAEAGYRPIVIERGQPVRIRTRDTWAFWRRGVFDPASNVQFGEGGAGTFSDGKLYSGIKDPANRARRVLEAFVASGAPAEILVVSKPHIGTFRLVTIVESMRARITALGGEYRFGTQVTGIDLATLPDGRRALRGLALSDGSVLPASHAVLAVGHSARDTFAMLHAAGVPMQAKPFSVGVRIEHPQGMIDRARFADAAGDPRLGAADYKLVHHGAHGRSVYSFCMCPGGTVVAATSERGRVVTNGMSQYSRAERNANAGIVVGITPADYPGGPLAGIDFQRRWEDAAFVAGGGTYAAPVQRVEDFLAARPSAQLGAVIPSYRPGVRPTDLAACLPDFATAAIRAALPAFGRKLAGFDLADAVLTGVETRTSSPVSIARGFDGQCPDVRGLYPAGEGAGYAGGILSAGVDGIKAAEWVARAMHAEAAAMVA